MNTRPSTIDHTRIVNIGDQPAIVVPTGTATGSFTRPLGKVAATPVEAMIGRNRADHHGDGLLRRGAGGWQVWGRTRGARGARGYKPLPLSSKRNVDGRQAEDYELLPRGVRAKRHQAGPGRLFIDE